MCHSWTLSFKYLVTYLFWHFSILLHAKWDRAESWNFLLPLLISDILAVTNWFVLVFSSSHHIWLQGQVACCSLWIWQLHLGSFKWQISYRKLLCRGHEGKNCLQSYATTAAGVIQRCFYYCCKCYPMVSSKW